MNILLVSLQDNLDVIGLKGLHYLLLDKGIESTLLFAPRYDSGSDESATAIARWVAERSPGLIGLSLMSKELPLARHLSAYLKRNLPEVPIVWGGIHPTINPEGCLDEDRAARGGRSLVDLRRAAERQRPGLR